MADLTILSSHPVYPSPSASGSGVYKSFIPGARTSRFSLVQSTTSLSDTLRRQNSEDSISDAEPDTSEDSQDTDDTSSSSSAENDQHISIFESERWNYGSRPSKFGTHEGYSQHDEDSQITPTVASNRPLSSSPPATSPAHIQSHNNLLPPPPQRGRQQYQRHRPTRSQSAPPSKTTFSQAGEVTPTASLLTPNASQMSFEQYTQHEARRQARPRRVTGYGYNPGPLSELNSPSQLFTSPPWACGYGVTKGGELLKPPPPLHRPTTFWRRTPRSGVTASSYSPSSHLIRRSTFVAAGLPFDRPMADLSALGVESRVRTTLEEERGAKVHDVFWEVVIDR
ncbi:hypothetical protein PQX77_011542 [Marasmius sp. AFHP31]|nr:hypothetical protein PQX77_011542 [Marasmius sp. AFHP31]